MKEYSSTDEKIIKATFKILQEEGFAKATTKKIAAEAGVNEVTIFRNFKNKNNLVESTKDYYLDLFINQLEEIFEFEEDQGIEEYLKISFFGILNLSDEDFSILRVAMEEVREIPEKKILISDITDVILNKLEAFFKLKIEKGVIREVNPKSLAIMCFGMLFQSVILWKIYNHDLDFETNYYADDLINIMFEGINP
ncbi:TetR/AcrR family transcriptional regulator [Methanobrevibacter sp.]|uniref:TetR/AcrR family transcriptional regulator n=1 Tax=Methanobrevibacter sp. TaxID=66852 RepID=UPI0025F295AC|nr:TetR/AcrR family transcriptional regulator [Methanobrevibacter sp.]MBQ6098379.1 TetR/AcrR family transcriptional regulator [Methanobrevibacter sp.]MBQ6513073.1 TetR/AcrR family transcriptional regulator [Methanobrevibacter sp.]